MWLQLLIIGHIVFGIILIASASLNKIGWIMNGLTKTIEHLYKIRKKIRAQKTCMLYPQIALARTIKLFVYLRSKAKQTQLIMGIGIVMFSKNMASLFGYYVIVWIINQWTEFQWFVKDIWYEIMRAYPWGLPIPM